MNFEDEPYVRIYTRDTKTWLKLGFEGQTVLMHVTRKLDRAGVLDDVTEPVEDVALVIGCSDLAFVRVGLERLLATGTLELRAGRLIAPNYIPAQTAVKSDRLRAQEARKRRRDLARLEITEGGDVTNRDAASADQAEVGPANDASGEPESASRDATPPSRAVSTESRNVTDPSRGDRERPSASRSILALPSLALDRTPLPPDSVEPAPAAQTPSTSSGARGKRSKSPNPRAKTQCPLDLKPDPTTAATAWELGFSDGARDFETHRCVDWARSKCVLRADWQATLRNWLRKSAEDRGLKPRKPRDERWAAYQEQLRKANDTSREAVAPPPGFERAVGGLFG